MAGKRCQCSTPQPTEWVKGKLVGSGSFGNVHLAMDKATGALFVVKSAESEVGIRFLDNEASILESLGSPYIVKCLGKEVNIRANGGRKLNLFMEYMAGGSLHDIAETFGGRLDENVICLYTKEILQGLKYLQKNGILHSDLKCKNVLLGSSGDIKLADFGCAKRLVDIKSKESSVSPFKSVGGTPLWMAPEVLRNESLDFAADIWSLGCTVIEMATGQPPWSDDGISNPLAAVLKIACSNELPKFPPYFSLQGLDFLAKCLERNPKKRPTAEELLDHPFIVGNPDQRQSRTEDSCSPTSVLDLETCTEADDSDQSSDEDDFRNKFPFSTMAQRRRKRNSWSSEDWITVRSNQE